MKTNGRTVPARPKEACPPGPPSFLLNLRLMVENEDKNIIYWDAGKIIIENPTRLVNEVLGKYFRHNQFASFQRQLHNFGFHKVQGKGRYVSSVYKNPTLKGFPAESILSVQRTIPTRPHFKGAIKRATSHDFGSRIASKIAKHVISSSPGSNSSLGVRSGGNDSSSCSSSTRVRQESSRRNKPSIERNARSPGSSRTARTCPTPRASKKQEKTNVSQLEVCGQPTNPVMEAAEMLHALSRLKPADVCPDCSPPHRSQDYRPPVTTTQTQAAAMISVAGQQHKSLQCPVSSRSLEQVRHRPVADCDSQPVKGGDTGVRQAFRLRHAQSLNPEIDYPGGHLNPPPAPLQRTNIMPSLFYGHASSRTNGGWNPQRSEPTPIGVDAKQGLFQGDGGMNRRGSTFPVCLGLNNILEGSHAENSQMSFVGGGFTNLQQSSSCLPSSTTDYGSGCQLKMNSQGGEWVWAATPIRSICGLNPNTPKAAQ